MTKINRYTREISEMNINHIADNSNFQNRSNVERDSQTPSSPMSATPIGHSHGIRRQLVGPSAIHPRAPYTFKLRQRLKKLEEEEKARVEENTDFR